MGMDAFIKVTLNSCKTEIECYKGRIYHKDIIYRDLKTRLFPPLKIYYQYDEGYGTHPLIVNIIGFENSFLNHHDDNDIFPECVFHDQLILDAEYYSKRTEKVYAKFEIHLNSIIENARPYENITGKIRYFDINVIKIIVALDNYINKPTIDCRLTITEELWYSEKLNLWQITHCSKNPEAFEKLPLSESIKQLLKKNFSSEDLFSCNGNIWCTSEDFLYWETYYCCQFHIEHKGPTWIREDDPFQPNENLSAELEIKIGEAQSVFMNMDRGVSYYKNLVYRDSMTGKFPILQFQLTKYSNQNRVDRLQLSLIGFKQSMLLKENETDSLCVFHKKYVYNPKKIIKTKKIIKIDLNEEAGPHKRAEALDIHVLELILSINDYVIKPSIDCQLTREKELYYQYINQGTPDPFKENMDNPYDRKNWSKNYDIDYWKKNKWTQSTRNHNKRYFIRDNPTTVYQSINISSMDMCTKMKICDNCVRIRLSIPCTVDGIEEIQS